MEIEYNKPYKYRELCDLFDEDYLSGGALTQQINRLSKNYEIEKVGRDYFIRRKYSKKQKKENGINSKIKNDAQFQVELVKCHGRGIYKIQLERMIYVGQTKDFRSRYMQHRRNTGDQNPITQEMLQNGGVFSIISYMPNATEGELNDAEREWILRFVNDEEYQCINSDFNVYKPRCRRTIDELSSFHDITSAELIYDKNIKFSEHLVKIENERTYINLTKITRIYQQVKQGALLKTWMNINRTVRTLYLWEKENNPNFCAAGWQYCEERRKANTQSVSPRQWISESNLLAFLIEKEGRCDMYAIPIFAYDLLMWLDPIKKMEILSKICETMYIGK